MTTVCSLVLSSQPWYSFLGRTGLKPKAECAPLQQIGKNRLAKVNSVAVVVNVSVAS